MRTSAAPPVASGALGALLCALLLGAAPSGADAPGRGVLDPGLAAVGAVERVVVSGVSGAAGAVRDAVERVGGAVRVDLPIVDGVGASVPADRLAELAGLPGVRAVTADRSAALAATSYDSYDPSESLETYPWSAGVGPSWAAGRDGAGVGIAVLDTGVSRVPDLAGRLVNGPDLSGEGRHDVDSFGHGTVMAGIAAGQGSGTRPRTGVAPGAHVVSVKVAGANGVTDVSTVLAAMHWVAAFKDTYGIRVLNLSWGVPSTQDPAVDPLDYAVERLWSLGIVVVVAAGNAGSQPGTVTKPGDDPVVLTVGAYNEQGDTAPANDTVPAWSSRGPTAQGLVKPDVLAPGRTLVATRAPGSTVEQQNPKALVGAGYIKGSGTSQAAAVVSGAAAVLLSERPGLTPDQVKAAFTATALPIAGLAPTTQGSGRVRLDRAREYDVSRVVPQRLVSSGLGSLDGARGAMDRVTVRCDGVDRLLDDETSAWCLPWDGGAWTGGAWTGGAWTGGAWTGGAWTGGAWTGGAWTGGAWTSAEYEGAADGFLTGFWGDRTRWWKRLPGEGREAFPSTARRGRE